MIVKSSRTSAYPSFQAVATLITPHHAGYSLPADDVSLSGSYYRNNSVEERLEAGGNGAETTESDDKGTSDLGQDKEVGKQKTGSPIMYVSWRVAQTA